MKHRGTARRRVVIVSGEAELPDHLTVVLEYASTQPAAQAREFLREVSHILQVIFSALLNSGDDGVVMGASVLL